MELRNYFPKVKNYSHWISTSADEKKWALLGKKLFPSLNNVVAGCELVLCLMRITLKYQAFLIYVTRRVNFLLLRLQKSWKLPQMSTALRLFKYRRLISLISKALRLRSLIWRLYRKQENLMRCNSPNFLSIVHAIGSTSMRIVGLADSDPFYWRNHAIEETSDDLWRVLTLKLHRWCSTRTTSRVRLI